jgi:hypothetical protein
MGIEHFPCAIPIWQTESRAGTNVRNFFRLFMARLKSFQLPTNLKRYSHKVCISPTPAKLTREGRNGMRFCFLLRLCIKALYQGGTLVPPQSTL